MLYIPHRDQQVQRSYLFKMVDRKPDFTLSVEDTAQVAPRHCKVWLRLDGFQVTGL